MQILRKVEMLYLMVQEFKISIINILKEIRELLVICNKNKKTKKQAFM